MDKPKKSAKKKARKRAAKEQPAGNNSTGTPPDWKPHLDQYKELRVLSFPSWEDVEAAIDLLWTDELRTLPHDTPDGRSIIVPAEAVEYFHRAGLQFTDKRLRSISELSPEQIARLRRTY